MPCLLFSSPAPLSVHSDFLPAQKAHIDQCVELINAKNLEIERAVDDLIESVKAYPFVDHSVKDKHNWEVKSIVALLPFRWKFNLSSVFPRATR